MTFIRACLVLSLLTLLCVVLYLPAVHPTAFFYDVISREHALNADYWGAGPAAAVRARFEREAAGVPDAVPLMPVARPARPSDMRVQAELDRLGRQLFHNDYMKALDGLLALASYRWCTLAGWLPPLLLLDGAALFDGAIRRVVKSREFSPPSAELFALCAGLGAVVPCAAALAMVLPLVLHPWVLPAAPLLLAAFAGAALANYHRRG